MRNVIIVGGGIAGLVSGFQLAKAGIPVTVIEKKSYPLHRVCGEYISNETVPFLRQIGLYPEQFSPPQINEFQLSSIEGKYAVMPLDLGGFGISRFAFDQFLFEEARKAGAIVITNTEVTDITFVDDHFELESASAEWRADVVIGSFGKRSRLDHSLDRAFISKRSPFAGIKYHIRYDQPLHRISLHNFPGGYCGISNVEGNIVNLCYLTHRENLKMFKDIRDMEAAILFKNPLLERIFKDAEFVREKPETINEISFETKLPVEGHILMAGDSAGMITPLCGNGMAMAIHSSKLVCESIIEFCLGRIDRTTMEARYNQQWRKHFEYRLWKGRKIQNLFGRQWLSNFAVNLALYSRPIANMLVRNTHGMPF